MVSERIVRELEIAEGWSRDFVGAIAPYYLATLDHMSRGHVTPVYEVIDKVWHVHILNTRDYAAFCDERFGRFIHHERSDEPLAVDADPNFFRHYGLSLEGLQALCGALTIETARCGEPDEPIPPNYASLARCGDPAPPSIGGSLARCGEGPAPPRLAAVARCGSPSPSPGPAPSPTPPRLRFTAETFQAGWR